MHIAGLRFLAVEDHEFQRGVLLRILKGLGAVEVSVAADGREALDLVKTAGGRVDVIISDLDMPGMDGLEFMRHLGEARVPVAIILVSALGRMLLASVETMSREYGVRILGVIEKPVTPKKLEALLARHAADPPAAQAKADRAFSVRPLVEGLKKKLGRCLRLAQPAPAVDRSVLAALCGADAAAERDILADFRRVNDADAAALALAASKGDVAAVTHACERIGTASTAIGAYPLAAVCRGLEQASRARDSDSLKAKMQAFERELGRVNSYCEGLKCTSPG